MKYRCIPCDHEFDADEGKKPRCPRCMSIHDVEPVASGGGGPGGRKMMAPMVFLLVVGAALAVWLLYPGDEPEGDGEEPTASRDLVSVLMDNGLSRKDAVVPFAGSEAITAWAEKAADGKDDLEGIKALQDAILAMGGGKGWKPHKQREPRREMPLSADELLARIQKPGDDGPWLATSYELACLLLAGARAVDIDARLVEIYSFDPEKSPADPGGKLGRYGVVLGEAKAGEKQPVHEPYSGRAGSTGTFFQLDDARAAAPFYGHQSLALLTVRDTSEANRKNEVAVALDPESPYYRTGRGLIYGASAAPAEALAEFEKAVKYRADAVTRTNLAEILLLAEPRGRRAESEVQQALTEMPDYSRGHAVLAMVHVLRGEFDQAEPELALADRLDPGSPLIAMFWAQYYAAQGAAGEAIEKAEQAVRLSGESASSLIALAGVYRATARFDRMRATLDKVLASNEFPGIAREIKEMFGYDPEGEEDDDEGELALGGTGDGGLGGLELKIGGSDRPLLGGGGRPGLGGGGGGGLLGGGDLQLDLDLK